MQLQGPTGTRQCPTYALGATNDGFDTKDIRGYISITTRLTRQYWRIIDGEVGRETLDICSQEMRGLSIWKLWHTVHVSIQNNTLCSQASKSNQAQFYIKQLAGCRGPDHYGLCFSFSTVTIYSNLFRTSGFEPHCFCRNSKLVSRT